MKKYRFLLFFLVVAIIIFAFFWVSATKYRAPKISASSLAIKVTQNSVTSVELNNEEKQKLLNALNGLAINPLPSGERAILSDYYSTEYIIDITNIGAEVSYFRLIYSDDWDGELILFPSQQRYYIKKTKQLDAIIDVLESYLFTLS